MPYKSVAQMRYMHAKHPDIAKRWDSKYGVSNDLPKRAKKVKRVKKPRSYSGETTT